MTTTFPQIVAPSDPQLDCIAALCEERGYPMPPVHSKTEASLIIGELLRGYEVTMRFDAETFDRAD